MHGVCTIPYSHLFSCFITLLNGATAVPTTSDHAPMHTLTHSTQLASEVIPPSVLVMHMGEHVLSASHESTQVELHPQALYQIIPHTLLQRTPHLGPVRSERVVSLGCLQAPCNEAAVCFMHAVRGLLQQDRSEP